MVCLCYASNSSSNALGNLTVLKYDEDDDDDDSFEAIRASYSTLAVVLVCVACY